MTVFKTFYRLILATSVAASGSLAFTGQASALSELRPGPAPAQDTIKTPSHQLQAFEATTLPLPDPAIKRSAQAEPTKPTETKPTELRPGTTVPVVPDAAKAAADAEPPAQVLRDMSTLPAPVTKLREQIVEAAASGDIERLKPLLGTGATQTQVMNNEGGDPIDTLKGFSGDPDGQEILAIMLDLLSTGAAHFDVGTADEMYVWPYFTAKKLESLTPPERVDLLRIVTAGDLIGMEEAGNYNFYRIGISPDGKWKFFSGGD
jgi:hypothetical protein